MSSNFYQRRQIFARSPCYRRRVFFALLCIYRYKLNILREKALFPPKRFLFVLSSDLSIFVTGQNSQLTK